jgi:hypothetical protein
MQPVLRALGSELGFAKLEYIWGIDFYSYPLMPSMTGIAGHHNIYPLKLTNITIKKNRDILVVIVRCHCPRVPPMLLSFALAQ